MSVEKAAGHGDDGEWWTVPPEKEDEEASLMDLVQERAQDRLNLKPPKRNNVRKPVDPENDSRLARARIAVPETSSVACRACGASDAYVSSASTAEYVCTACGVVARDIRPVELREFTGSHVRAQVDARINYFRERLSQWAGKEPPIPATGMQKICVAYDRCRNGEGPFRPSDVLTKPEIRALVVEAGLPPKNCVEKWLTIRAVLLKRASLPDERPAPTQHVLSECMRHFSTFLAAWDRHPELRAGRKSLPNYNYLIARFLLLVSPDIYDTYAVWFPQVTSAKRVRLQEMFDSYCDIIGWPRYQAQYDRLGRVHRQRQNTIGSVKDNT